jgi:hypothetical protein
LTVVAKKSSPRITHRKLVSGRIVGGASCGICADDVSGMDRSEKIFEPCFGCRLNWSAFARQRQSITIQTMPEIGKLLVLIGIGFVLVGSLLWSGFGKGWLGQLPGDINYSKGNFSFHFPVVTCIILSILLSLFWRLLRK